MTTTSQTKGWRTRTWMTAAWRQGLVAGLSALVILWANVGTLRADTVPAGQTPAGLTATEWRTIQAAVEEATYRVDAGTHEVNPVSFRIDVACASASEATVLHAHDPCSVIHSIHVSGFCHTGAVLVFLPTRFTWC